MDSFRSSEHLENIKAKRISTKILQINLIRKSSKNGIQEYNDIVLNFERSTVNFISS